MIYLLKVKSIIQLKSFSRLCVLLCAAVNIMTSTYSDATVLLMVLNKLWIVLASNGFKQFCKRHRNKNLCSNSKISVKTSIRENKIS